MLNNRGWLTDEFSSNCNVYTERVKTNAQTQKLKKISGYKKPPDYVLYETDTDNPIVIIEAKRKGQSVDDALKDAITKYAVPLGIKIVFAYDGAFFKSCHVDYNKELYLDDQVVSQIITEKKILQFLDEGYSIMEKTPKVIHSRSELISIFKYVNGLLRKEGLDEGKERLYEFSNILFLKLVSEIEEERERNNEKRIVSKDFCWDKFCKKNAEDMYYYVNNTVLKELKNTYGEIFDDKLKIKKTTLKTIVDKLSEITLMNIESDVKGDAFEYFLKASVTTGTDLGQYFTPRHIIDLMINLVEPKFGEKIYDPTCGTGGFLIRAFNYIKGRSANTDSVLKTLKGDTVFGRELTGTAKIAKMNMIITGDGHNNIEQMDALEYKISNKYDVVVANPPYGQDTDYGNLYDIPSNDGDVIFLQHIIDSLKNGGRAAVVIPEGVLFRPHADKKLRKWMLTNCNIEAIISLPIGIFRPYTKNKTNIIIFKKDKKGTKSIWFYNLTADGFDTKSDLRRPVDENDIPDLLSKWTDKIISDKSWNVKIDEIKSKNYELMPKTYKLNKEFDSQYPIVPFSNIMRENKNTIIINDDVSYQRITIKLYGKGIIPRDKTKGEKIQTKNQKLTKTNQFAVAELDAKFGAFGIIPNELANSIVSSHYFLFDLDEKQILPEYFDYMIRFGPYDKIIQQYVKGTTNYAAIRPKHILQLNMPLPPKDIQEVITHSIRNQTNIIDNAQNTIDAIKNGITDISDFYGDYKYQKIQDVCSRITNGSTPSRQNPQFFKGDIPWIKITDMHKLDYTVDAEEKITNKAIDSKNMKSIPKGSVLFTIYATIGAVSVLGIENAYTNQAIVALTPKKNIMPKFLMYYLHTLNPYFKTKSRGVTQNNINLSILKSVKIPIPTLSQQNNIIKTIDERNNIVPDLNNLKKSCNTIIQNIIDELFKPEL